MIRRRVIALLMSVTLLHLSVVAGDAACATHGAAGEMSAPSTHDMPMGGHAMPAAGAAYSLGSAAVTSPPAPCETPVATHCCDAVAGCGPVSVAARSHSTVALAKPLGARIHASRHDAPASFASSPEPPPPKA
ncbi:MAG: hypothetical protein ABI625_14380 [bacterium]